MFSISIFFFSVLFLSTELFHSHSTTTYSARLLQLFGNHARLIGTLYMYMIIRTVFFN